MRCSADRFIKYGLTWPKTVSALSIERDMVRLGGQKKLRDGSMAGEGLFFHFKRFEELLWPEKTWHRWNTLQLECYLKYRTIVAIGPASSGKTHSAATDALADWLCFPECTTILLCSTTRERLEDRIWGEVKKYHRLAAERAPWMTGHLIEGRQRLMLDSKNEFVEGRDFRNGIIGVPCKRGSDFVGLGDFAGVKNKRVRLIGDELSLLPRAFVDSLANLDKNPDFKAYGLGNPKDTTDALGVLAEPARKLGGWDSGIDQQPGTKTWPIVRPEGICIQLPGSDSPNLDGSMSIPLITQAAIDRDIETYGRDSLQFTMMDEGRMPRGQGSRRVLTRQLCAKFHAQDPPNWRDTRQTSIAFLDAAYGGVGGDRCIFGELRFGEESEALDGGNILSNIIFQGPSIREHKQIISLVDHIIVPINVSLPEPAADQIATFVKMQCEQRGIPPSNFFFDSGMRTALVQAFSRIWSVEVQSVDCGGKASESQVSSEIQKLCKDYYFNRVTELWYSVRLAVESGQFRSMSNEAMQEFCDREWQIVGNNKIQVEPKDKMKEKTSRSPDIADGVAIGVWGARNRGFVIRKLAPPERERKQDLRWRSELMQKARDLNASGQLSYA